MCENKIISKSHHCQIYFKIKYWKIRISVNKKQVSCFFEHKCECKNYVTTPNQCIIKIKHWSMYPLPSDCCQQFRSSYSGKGY